MSVLCIEINSNHWHFLAVLPVSAELAVISDEGPCLADDYGVCLRQTGEQAGIESAISPMQGVRRHKQYKSWPLIEACIEHLAGAMDEELGNGAELFAHLPAQPLDGAMLI
jgi:hypothetical protein